MEKNEVKWTKTDPGEGRVKRHDDRSTIGDPGLDPGPEQFLLQRTSRAFNR